MILAVATLKPAFGDVSRSKNALHQNTRPTNLSSKFCDKDFSGYIWWRKFYLVDFFVFGALVHGDVCCEISVDFFKEENKSK